MQFVHICLNKKRIFVVRMFFFVCCVCATSTYKRKFVLCVRFSWFSIVVCLSSFLFFFLHIYYSVPSWFAFSPESPRFECMFAYSQIYSFCFSSCKLIQDLHMYFLCIRVSFELKNVDFFIIYCFCCTVAASTFSSGWTHNNYNWVVVVVVTTVLVFLNCAINTFAVYLCMFTELPECYGCLAPRHVSDLIRSHIKAT